MTPPPSLTSTTYICHFCFRCGRSPAAIGFARRRRADTSAQARRYSRTGPGRPLKPYGAAPARAAARQPAKARHAARRAGPARRRQRLPAALAQVGRAPHRRGGRGRARRRPPHSSRSCRRQLAWLRVATWQGARRRRSLTMKCQNINASCRPSSARERIAGGSRRRL